VVYAPDVVLSVEVEQKGCVVAVQFVDDERVVMGCGEVRRMRIWVGNEGAGEVGEVWVVAGSEDEIWVDVHGGGYAGESSVMHMREACSHLTTADAPKVTEVLHSDNSLAPGAPYQIIGGEGSSALGPGGNMELSIALHASHIGSHHLCLLFVICEVGSLLVFSCFFSA
jgi:trafficking protein particle complex subunit 8